MRNVFDQYTQKENRLTHALATCLREDGALRRDFLSWATGKRQTRRGVEVLQQSLPGQRARLDEDEAERRGLPDICLADAAGWALLVESKVAAPASLDQVRRHRRTAERHRLLETTVLLLVANEPRWTPPTGVIVRTWSALYVWLADRKRPSHWVSRLIEFMETADAQWAAERYLKEGALTTFAGIPFARSDAEYGYTQAKRVLELLRKELVKNEPLRQRLGVDSANPGRGAITGRQSETVWDFLGLREAKQAGAFTRFPHLTLGLTADRLEAYVTVPNGVAATVRRRLAGNSFDEFETLIRTVTERLLKAIRKAPGAAPRIVVVQRRYSSQRADPTMDCLLRFDPRTAIPVAAEVKLQSQWLRATHDALRRKVSNLQFQIGVDFPYRSCRKVASTDIVDVVADVWLACAPLIAICRGQEPHQALTSPRPAAKPVQGKRARKSA